MNNANLLTACLSLFGLKEVTERLRSGSGTDSITKIESEWLRALSPEGLQLLGFQPEQVTSIRMAMQQFNCDLLPDVALDVPRELKEWDERGLRKLSSLNLYSRTDAMKNAMLILSGIADPDLQTVCQFSVHQVQEAGRLGVLAMMMIRLALADIHMCLLGDDAFLEEQMRNRNDSMSE